MFSRDDAKKAAQTAKLAADRELITRANLAAGLQPGSVLPLEGLQILQAKNAYQAETAHLSEPAYKSVYQHVGAAVTRAMAFDDGKLDMNLVPPEWEEWLVGPFAAGIKKGYPRDNWKESLNTEEHDTFRMKRLNSLRRHVTQYRKGEVFDPETGCHHLILAAWNGLCIAWYDLNKKDETDASTK